MESRTPIIQKVLSSTKVPPRQISKTNMKEIKAYALITKRGNLAVLSAKLPIFWKRKVAIDEAQKYGYEVIEVVVETPTKTDNPNNHGNIT